MTSSGDNRTVANDSYSDFLITSVAMLSCLARKLFVVNNHLTNGVSFNLESCWSRSVLSVITAICLSTQRVWHTFNYDVTVSNGVNLCRPSLLWIPGPRSTLQGCWESMSHCYPTVIYMVVELL